MVDDGFHVRRVIVGRGDDGAPTILSDGTPPLTIDAPSGFGVSELLTSAGPLTSLAAGGDPPREGVGAFPANGGMAARLIRFPATNEWVRIAGDDPERPGMHRSETLDLMVVLSGRIVLGVEDGEDEIGPGDSVIQRGTLHRWRVTGQEPCTYLSVLLAPVEGATVPSPPLSTLQAEPGPTLFVTGTGPQGSTIEARGTSAPDDYGRRQWWDTGGPVRSLEQGSIGGRTSQDSQPASGSVSLAIVDLAVASEAGHAGYTTGRASIDLVTVLSGTLTTSLAASGGTSATSTDFDKVTLAAGDVLITRGVDVVLASASAQVAVVSFVPAVS